MKKIVIIGGGAGGAGAATRCRRLDEFAKITIYEKSSYASYSNCGLPYKFSGLINKFSKLIIATPKVLKDRYNLDVKVKHEVFKIDPNKKVIKVKDLINDQVFEKEYDELIIAAGAPAIIPNLQEVAKAKNIFSLKTLDDVKNIEEYISKNKVQDVVVIGGGYIGSEIAENFKESNYNVTIIDAAKHLLFNSLDEDFAAYIQKSTIEKGINLVLNSKVIEVTPTSVKLESGKEIKADLIFMTVGVKPKLDMFIEANIKIGDLGGIAVDKYQKTNIPHIYAVGDLTESIDYKGDKARVTLAFPASRQATIAANTIYDYKDGFGQSDYYKGSTAAATLSMFDTTVASVGKIERELIKEGIKYNKTVNAWGTKISPIGGVNIFLKVLYDDNFKILGAQSAGPKSAEKRISYISLAMMNNISYDKFEDFMVAYSPTVDTTFDVTSMGARLAKHQKDGSLISIFPEDIEKFLQKGYQIIDVREAQEWEKGTIKNAKLVAMSSIRENLHQLPKDGKYIIHCNTGARSYNTCLILRARGFIDVVNLAGGYSHYSNWKKYGKL